MANGHYNFNHHTATTKLIHELMNPHGKLIFNPIFNKSVWRNQLNAITIRFGVRNKWTNPSVKLLFGELSAEEDLALWPNAGSKIRLHIEPWRF
jgi:hypothetical protein